MKSGTTVNSKKQGQTTVDSSRQAFHQNSQKDVQSVSSHSSRQHSDRQSVLSHDKLKAQSNNNLGSSGSNTSLKSFQPVLKQKDELVNKNPVGGAQLKKQGSGGNLDKKSGKKQTADGGKQVSMKEQPFNYEQKSAHKSKDNTPNSHLFKKNSPFIVEEEPYGARYAQPNDDEIIEVKHNDNHQVNDSRLEDRIRPSDEVQYQDNYSRDDREMRSTLSQNSKKEMIVGNNRGTVSSFKVVEERKSDLKDFRVVENHQSQDEKFEVVREDVRDSSAFLKDIDNRHNSDFKRFNIDDDLSNLQSLRLANQRNLVGFDNAFEETGSHPIGFRKTQDQEYEQQLQDTPQNIRSKTRNQELVDQEKSLKSSSQMFVPQSKQQQQQIQRQDTGTGSPQSFGSPQKSNVIQGQQNEVSYKNQNPAHILSFADQNIANQLEYPPLQPSDPDMLNIYNDRSQSQTPLLQKQRLSEIMKMSQGGSLDNSQLVSSKIDEKALTNMIDLEKNYVIMQYENILQQLNIEFHKLLAKTKETEDQVQAKEQLIQAQSQIIAEKEHQNFIVEQQNRQMQQQIQELMNEIEFLSMQSQKSNGMEQQNDAWRYERDILDEKIQTLQNKVICHEQNEQDIKDQLELSQNKLRQAEAKIRAKEEELFQVSRDNQSLQRDIRNIKDIEVILKNEKEQQQAQRLAVEDNLQDSKQKLTALQLQIRQRDNEVENCIRENRNLAGTLEALQQNFQEVFQENNLIKEHLTQNQQEIIQLRNHLEKQSREIRNYQQDLKKAQMLFDQEKMNSQQMEQHYQLEVERLSNQLAFQENLIQNQRNIPQQQYQPPQQFAQLQDNNLNKAQNNQKFQNQQFPQSRQQQNTWENENNQSLRSFEDNRNYKSNTQLNSTTNFKQDFNNEKQMQKIQPPLQEQQQNYYSPQRNARGQQLLQDKLSPNLQQKADTYSKNTIAWTSMWNGAAQVQNQQQPQRQDQKPQIVSQQQQQQPKQRSEIERYNNYTPQKQQQDLLEGGNTTMRERRKTLKQNQSQLHDVLSWDQSKDSSVNQSQNFPQSITKGQRSLERPEMIQKSEGKFNFLNQPAVVAEPRQNSQPQQQQNSQNWQQMRSPGAPGGRGGKGGSQELEIQAAGKKSTIQQSPFRNKNNEQTINHLQNSLSVLTIDKEKMENEYRKLGAPKNKMQIEKKQEMEFEIDILGKNIQNVRQKLRELNAL